jgi:predicted NBD/HSP70 family sugar kinase
MYILFDIGGTKTRVAASEDLRSYGEPVKFETKLPFDEGIRAVIDAIDTVRGGKKVTAIAGGIRGPLNHEKTGIISEKKLVDWVGRPIVETLAQHFSAPVYLENDTAIVGLGEAVHGAGKGYNIVAYHTVSTGVGGARFVHGKLDVTSVGFEPGHQLLDIDRSILGHAVPHTLENLVSGTALEKRRGKKPYEIPQDDPVWDELALWLAHGLKNTITYWSPDAIVLGGSMVIGDPRIFRENIERHTKKVLDGLVPCPPILDAVLKDEGGLYGAMALIESREKGS